VTETHTRPRADGVGTQPRCRLVANETSASDYAPTACTGQVVLSSALVTRAVCADTEVGRKTPPLKICDEDHSIRDWSRGATASPPQSRTSCQSSTSAESSPLC